MVVLGRRFSHSTSVPNDGTSVIALISLVQHVRYMPARCAPGKPLQHALVGAIPPFLSIGLGFWIDSRCDLPQRHGRYHKRGL